MSTNTVVCLACRGQKEAAGMGGIIKTCVKCSGKGRVERTEPVFQVSASSVPQDTGTVTIAPDAEIKVNYEQAKPKRKSRAKAVETKDMFQDTVSLAQIVSGETSKAPVVDEFTAAIIDEPRMPFDVWQAKYKHISRLFGINPMTQKFDCLVSQVQRAAIRESFALSQPRATRKVNVKKSQDMAAESDAEYLSFKAQQDAREQAEAQS